MTDIKRAAWLATPHDAMNPFTVNEPDGLDFWLKNGMRVRAVVEVQPVLDALKGIYSREKLEEVIDQLEKAAQP